MGVGAALKKDVGLAALLLYTRPMNESGEVRQVHSRVDLVHAVCRRRKVRQFGDFRELIHFSEEH
jgi:hypothetical protein